MVTTRAWVVSEGEAVPMGVPVVPMGDAAHAEAKPRRNRPPPPPHRPSQEQLKRHCGVDGDNFSDVYMAASQIGIDPEGKSLMELAMMHAGAGPHNGYVG